MQVISYNPARVVEWQRGDTAIISTLDFEEIGNKLIKGLLDRRRRQRKNTVILLVGGSGEGKSNGGITIALIDQPDFNPLEQIVYDPKQINVKIEQAKEVKWKVLMPDEVHIGLDARDFATWQNITISQIIATFREYNQLTLIMIAPTLGWIDTRVRGMVDFYGIARRSENKAYLEFYGKDINYHNLDNQQPFLKAIHFRLNGTERIFGGFHVYPLPDNIKEQYENISIPFKQSLLKTDLSKLPSKFEAKEQKKVAKKQEAEKRNLEEILNEIITNTDARNAYVKKSKKGEPKIMRTDLRKDFGLSAVQTEQVASLLMEKMKP